MLDVFVFFFKSLFCAPVCTCGESVECCGLYNYIILEIKEEDKRDGKEKIEECKKDGVREIR